jgi:hypothetical protein
MIHSGYLRRFLVALAVLVGLLVPVTAIRVIATFVALGCLPLAPAVGRCGFSPLSRLALALAVSPTVFAVTVMLVIFAGAAPHTAVWVVTAAALTVFVAAGRNPLHDLSREERRRAIALLAVVAAAAVLALTLPLTHTWWRYRSDSWFHAAVFERISLHGLPAVDPYFSPLRLQYMYVYHVALLCVSTLSGLGPFFSMIWLNFLALAACVLGVDMLAGHFSRRTAPRIAAAFCSVFAMNGLFFLFFPIRIARSLLGHSAGIDQLRHFFPLTPPGHDTALRFLSIQGNQALFLDKFMLGTALSLTLGTTCVVLALLLAAGRGRWDRPTAFLYTASVATVLYLHLVMGVTVLAATGAAILAMAVTGGGARAARLAILTGLAVAVAAPYIWSVVPHTGQSQVRIGMQGSQAVGILSDVLPAAIPLLALWVWRRRSTSAWTDARSLWIFASWAGTLLVMALVVDLPTNNETKFSFPLFLTLSALAAAAFEYGWSRGRARTQAVGYVALCTVPLNVFYFQAAFRDATRFEVTPSEKTAYEWIRRTTPTNAIFLDNHDVVRVPVLGQRDQYWGTEAYARNWGYPVDEMERRRTLRDRMYGQTDAPREDLAAISSLERPFFVMVRNRAIFEKLSEDPRFERRFSAGETAVFEVNPESLPRPSP